MEANHSLVSSDSCALCTETHWAQSVTTVHSQEHACTCLPACLPLSFYSLSPLSNTSSVASAATSRCRSLASGYHVVHRVNTPPHTHRHTVGHYSCIRRPLSLSPSRYSSQYSALPPLTYRRWISRPLIYCILHSFLPLHNKPVFSPFIYLLLARLLPGFVFVFGGRGTEPATTTAAAADSWIDSLT